MCLASHAGTKLLEQSQVFALVLVHTRTCVDAGQQANSMAVVEAIEGNT
jgi:hypothetical protein